MQAFVAPLRELAEYEAIQKSKKEKHGLIQITGCVSSQKTHFMYALGDGFIYKISWKNMRNPCFRKRGDCSRGGQSCSGGHGLHGGSLPHRGDATDDTFRGGGRRVSRRRSIWRSGSTSRSTDSWRCCSAWRCWCPRSWCLASSQKQEQKAPRRKRRPRPSSSLARISSRKMTLSLPVSVRWRPFWLRSKLTTKLEPPLVK